MFFYLSQRILDMVARTALEPFERGANGENPFAIQYELQTTMQNLVGIVRRQEEMEQAVKEIAVLKQRAAKAGATGNREYNGGWHTGLDLANLTQHFLKASLPHGLAADRRGAGQQLVKNRPERVDIGPRVYVERA